jgi:microcystin degradation protein MlrC
MPRILIAGYQHETNTFAPSLADWTAFTRGDSFPPFMRGAEMQAALSGINIPVAGFIDAARHHGWTLVPSAWAGAIPSSYVTEDAFERIADAIVDDVKAARITGLDGIYLDLHGAAVAQHADDSEGELIGRLRALVGPELPIVASLDLHANVTTACCARPTRWCPTAPTRTSTWPTPARWRPS